MLRTGWNCIASAFFVQGRASSIAVFTSLYSFIFSLFCFYNISAPVSISIISDLDEKHNFDIMFSLCQETVSRICLFSEGRVRKVQVESVRLSAELCSWTNLLLAFFLSFPHTSPSFPSSPHSYSLLCFFLRIKSKHKCEGHCNMFDLSKFGLFLTMSIWFQ